MGLRNFLKMPHVPFERENIIQVCVNQTARISHPHCCISRTWNITGPKRPQKQSNLWENYFLRQPVTMSCPQFMPTSIFLPYPFGDYNPHECKMAQWGRAEWEGHFVSWSEITEAQVGTEEPWEALRKVSFYLPFIAKTPLLPSGLKAYIL